MAGRKYVNSGRRSGEFKIHTIALTIAIAGPLINFWIKPFYAPAIASPYFYWALALTIYVGLLIPSALDLPNPFVTLFRLVLLGVPVEDFCSNVWKTLFTTTSGKFLPFFNWYTQHFPFIGSLGEPTPMILIPKWYILSLFLYLLVTVYQYRLLKWWTTINHD